MFTWLNKQGVRSDLGFEVQQTGRFTAEYREGSKRISFEVESGGSTVPSIFIAEGAFRFWEGSDLPNSPEEQARIFKNVSDAMKFQGYRNVL